MTERWQVQGLPTYAQFDNDTIFQGAHQFANAIGRVSRLCLALKVTPVFAPPREPGFQNAIEGFNALWQSKVWQRHHCPDVASLVALSQRYIAAYRAKTAPKRESAPHRHVLRYCQELWIGGAWSGGFLPIFLVFTAFDLNTINERNTSTHQG